MRKKGQPVLTRRIFLQRQSDGSFIDWGRSVSVGGVRGEGGAVWYQGEDAKVMALVIKHSEQANASK